MKKTLVQIDDVLSYKLPHDNDVKKTQTPIFSKDNKDNFFFSIGKNRSILLLRTNDLTQNLYSDKIHPIYVFYFSKLDSA